MLHNALESLPDTLDETYERVLCSIGNNYYAYAYRILEWLSCSLRPLYWDEVAESIVIELGKRPRLNLENRLVNLGDILTICSSLISIDDSKTSDYEDFEGAEGPLRSCDIFVRLAHLSVKEYLVSKRIQESSAKLFHIDKISAHHSISNACITYLLEYHMELSPPAGYQNMATYLDDLVTQWPLALYAATYWPRHTEIAESDSSYEPCLALKLLKLGKPIPLFARRLRPNKRGRYSKVANPDISVPGAALYIALQLGLLKSVSALIAEGMYVNMKGGYIGNALACASGHGQGEVVRILLDNGADVNADEDDKWHNALHLAAALGHPQIVLQLLEHGASCENPGHVGDVLITAIQNHHVEVVRILVDWGSDVNRKDCNGGTPLAHACHLQEVDILQCLLDAGADIEAQGWGFGNALTVASHFGNPRAVTKLLEHGANVNGRLDGFRNPLQEAARCGELLVVEILLHHGADVNAQCKKSQHGNALQAASSNGHMQIVRTLIENGADVNAHNQYGESYNGVNALQAAINNGHHYIVQILLDNGATLETRPPHKEMEAVTLRVTARDESRVSWITMGLISLAMSLLIAYLRFDTRLH